MAKSRPADKGPSRRAERKAPVSADEVRGAVASEITARLRQIAEVQAPPGGVTSARAAQPNPFGPKRRGAEVADKNLLSGGRPSSKARVIAINAFPHPEEVDRVVLQLDGWDGHLQLTIPRDRAVMLVARLQRAIDESAGAHHPIHRPPDPPVEVAADAHRARGARPSKPGGRPTPSDRRRRRDRDDAILGDALDADLTPLDDNALADLAAEPHRARCGLTPPGASPRRTLPEFRAPRENDPPRNYDDVFSKFGRDVAPGSPGPSNTGGRHR